VVTLVDDHVTIIGHEVVHLVAASEALNHGDVELAVRFAFSSSDLTDPLGFEVQKQRELGDPLLE
jgi:hypothetical protein